MPLGKTCMDCNKDFIGVIVCPACWQIRKDRAVDDKVAFRQLDRDHRLRYPTAQLDTAKAGHAKKEITDLFSQAGEKVA